MDKNLQHLSGATTRIIDYQGGRYLFFGGTAYLGLLNDKAFIDLYKKGLDIYGLNNGTSRNNNIQIDIYDKAELEMARRFGYEDCILISSGYLAAQLVIRALTGMGEFLYAPGAHPALWRDANDLSTYQSFDDWKSFAVDHIHRSNSRCFIIVSNTLDNLTPETYDFSGFKDIDPQKELYFILDDSHGIGVKGAEASFVDLSHITRENIHVVLVASLAKGLGTDAGAILCSATDGIFFRKSPFFTGASPASPAAMYALLHGIEIFQERSKLLQEHIVYLDSLLAQNVRRISGFPVFTVANPNAFAYFKKNKILISSFSYPLPSDPPVNRIVLSSAHHREDIDRLAEVLRGLD